MRKKVNPTYASQCKYNARRRAEGWKSYYVFAPPAIVDEIKQLLKDRKAQLGLYDRPQWAEKPIRSL